MRWFTKLVTVILLSTIDFPVSAQADGLGSVASEVQFDVKYRCLARGASEPPPDKAHLWVYPVDTNRSFTPGIRVFVGFPNDVDYEDLDVIVSADVTGGFNLGSWIFKNKSRIYGNRADAVELSSVPEETRGLIKVRKITRIQAIWEKGLFDKVLYDCSLYGQTPSPDPEPPTDGTCTPTTDVLHFDGDYRVRMCYITGEGETGQARAGVWSSSQSGILWFFSRENAEVLVKVLDGCGHNGHRWVFVAPVTTLGFGLRITAPNGETWTHTNQVNQTASTKSDTNAFRCR